MTNTHTNPTLRLLLIFALTLLTPPSTLMALPKFGKRVVTKTHQQLDKIILQATHLQDATITECRNYIISRSIQLDHELDPSKKGVSITIITPPAIPPSPRLISYNARNASITTATTEIAKRSNLDLYITSAGIVFTPPGTPPFPNKLAKKGDIWNTLHKHKNPTNNKEAQDQKK